ncbi:MAG: DinB family protein [Planctomycetota bacterium]
MSAEAILESWATNQRIHEMLIDDISSEGMRCTLSTRGGRNVVRQFAHIHNVRIYHLERRAKKLLGDLEKYETKAEPDKRALKKSLRDSAAAIATFFEDCLDGKPKRRGFKRGVIQHLSYFIAHESHHRGIILLTLKQCGHPVDKDLRMGIWDWDRLGTSDV